MQKQRRWLRAAITASAVPQPPLPWTRGQRHVLTALRGLTALAPRPPTLNQK